MRGAVPERLTVASMYVSGVSAVRSRSIRVIYQGDPFRDNISFQLLSIGGTSIILLLGVRGALVDINRKPRFRWA